MLKNTLVPYKKIQVGRANCLEKTLNAHLLFTCPIYRITVGEHLETSQLLTDGLGRHFSFHKNLKRARELDSVNRNFSIIGCVVRLCVLISLILYIIDSPLEIERCFTNEAPFID